jgi:hypothetical protein
LIINELAILFENLITVRAASVLQFVNRLGIKEVILPFLSVRVLASFIKQGVDLSSIRKTTSVSQQDFFGDYIEAYSADPRGCPGKVAIDEVLV